jgi:2-polyprenyl-6-methoxyphenol hydroxylase-like FAD-dependent oxidoreductase
MRVVVVGAGVGGCAAGLAFARRGHEVTVVDRHEPAPATDPDTVFAEWARASIAQFRQPHNFLGKARRILRDQFPDVYAALLAAGATEVDQAGFLGDAPRQPGDEDLATIACRRPVFDALVLSTVLNEPGLDYRRGTVAGLTSDRAHVTGVRLGDGNELEADLVVDAAGRASGATDWLDECGLPAYDVRTSECGLLYYSKHYRIRPGSEMPVFASLLGGPRGDLGYLAFATFIGDNDTFSVAVMCAPTSRDFRMLRDDASFERVTAALPGMADWVDPDRTEPASAVLPMGQLRNTLRTAMKPAPGYVAIADARCHTNPTFAFGMSLALDHAVVLADVADKAADPVALVQEFAAAIEPDATARFNAVSSEDAARVRLWSGEPVDVTDRNDEMSMFLRAVVYRVSVRDPDLLRAVCRRVNALDPPDWLENQPELLDRASALYAEMSPAGALPPPPPREELQRLLAT